MEAPEKKAEALGTGLIGRNANRFIVKKRKSVQGKVLYDDTFLIRQGVTYSDRLNKNLNKSTSSNPYRKSDSKPNLK